MRRALNDVGERHDRVRSGAKFEYFVPP